MTQWITHLAVDEKTIPGGDGNADIHITPGTYVMVSNSPEEAKEDFDQFEELMEPNAELTIYRMDQEFDIDAIQAQLDQDTPLTSEQGASVIKNRSWTGEGRITADQLDSYLEQSVRESTEEAEEPA